MNNIPTVDLYRCIYRKEQKYLSLPSEYFGMPSEFYVKSHHTGKCVRFVCVQPGHPLFDEDQYDGEQQVYVPVEHIKNVDHMVIYNQY
jgi:hypothetical protein